MIDTVENPIQAANHLKSTFIKNAKSTGIMMIVIGVIGILTPNVLSLTLNVFIGSLFLLAALALAHSAWQNKTQHISLWFKPFIMAMLAFIVLLHPAIVLSVLGLLVAIYFLFSGFSSMVMSFELQSSKGKWLLLFNGMMSFVLGAIVFGSWPFGSAWIIGLLIGISFLFDGIALVSLSGQLKESQD